MGDFVETVALKFTKYFNGLQSFKISCFLTAAFWPEKGHRLLCVPSKVPRVKRFLLSKKFEILAAGIMICAIFGSVAARNSPIRLKEIVHSRAADPLGSGRSTRADHASPPHIEHAFTELPE